MKFFKNFIQSLIATVCVVTLVGFLMIFNIIPYSATIFGKFLIGALFLIIGQTIFLMAIDGGIIKIGQMLGSSLMKTQKIWLIIFFGFLFGLVTTITEPDVLVLVSQLVQVNSLFTSFLLLSVISISCSLLVCLGLVRILKNLSLKWVLFILYGIIIILCFFTPSAYLGFAFDSGGSTTGAITVPFMLTLVIGICAIRGKNSKNDSFGLIAIISTGPIIALLILGIIFDVPTTAIFTTEETLPFNSVLLEQIIGVFRVFIPLFIIFLFAQFLLIKMSVKEMFKIAIQVIISGIGLALFLTGVKYGFGMMGEYIGGTLAISGQYLSMTLFVMILSLIVVFTEPAIIVLASQIEEVTTGFIKKSMIYICIAIGVAIASLITIIHIIFAIPFIYVIIPLLVIVLILNFFIPKIFMSIAFDSGGIAAGTMTITFLLPIFLGFCKSMGLDIMEFGFGCVGITGIIPILVIQIVGLIYNYKQNKVNKQKKDNVVLMQEVTNE